MFLELFAETGAKERGPELGGSLTKYKSSLPASPPTLSLSSLLRLGSLAFTLVFGELGAFLEAGMREPELVSDVAAGSGLRVEGLGLRVEG